MSFNKEQLQALKADLHKNVVVSAGAGSGKTRTLTQKVINILTGNGSDKLEPSELLILTFTNNAAHDMKRKIVEACKDIPNINDIISSAHIQTFDSFSNDLVKKYSSYLGISDSINVIQQDVNTSNIRSYIDQIVDEYEQNDDPLIIDSIKKTSLKDDENLKSIIFEVYTFMDKLLPKDKEDFIDLCSNKVFERKYFDYVVNTWVQSIKNDIIDNVKTADLINSYYEAFDEVDIDIELLTKFYMNPSYFTKDYKNLSFKNDEVLQGIYEYTLTLLEKDGYEFIKEAYYARNVLTGKKQTLGKPLDKEAEPNVKAAYAQLKKIYHNKTAILGGLTLFGEYTFDADDPTINSYSADKEYNKVCYFKDDIKLIFEIIEKLDALIKMNNKLSGSYTFSDISKMALTLIQNNDDIASELREQFKFIMIDEYQDTNDLQEQFIDVLLKPRKSDGGTASLFCVGDSKQSIYAFRNSNVALFNKRLNDPTTTKVFMNKNYRSGEKLLQEINYIFKYYMTKSNGDIEYLKNDESLKYDKEVNLYSKPYNNFGVKRIILEPSELVEDDEYECYAIINDIKNKMNDPNFLVSERAKENVLRRAKYSDFCILMRRKKAFDLYRRIFAKEGIKLNLVYAEDLQQADAIIVIQSLLSLIAYINGDIDSLDVAHAYISVVRSFLYSYSDQQVFDLLTDHGKYDGNSIERIKLDPVYIKISEFVENHKDSDFHKLVLDMFSEFDILNKVVLIGSINDNFAKIESLYKTILNEESTGGNIRDFIYLLKNISKRNLGFDSELQVEMDDAVSMMTIHASKGLERKIIYMPYSHNKKSGGQSFGEHLVDINNKLGVVLPYFTNNVGEETIYPDSLYGRALGLFEDGRIESDEHVRLLYVALTRAENTVYLVGNPAELESIERRKGTLYGMLSYMPHYPKITDKGLEVISRRISPTYYETEIEPYIKLYCASYVRLHYSDFSNSKDYYFYSKLYENERYTLTMEYIDRTMKIPYDLLFESLFTDLENDYKNSSIDFDLVSRMYGYWKYGVTSKGFDNLIEELNKINDTKKNKFMDDDGAIPEGLTLIYVDEKEIRESINFFVSCIFDASNNLGYFYPDDDSKNLKKMVEIATEKRMFANNKNTPFEIEKTLFFPMLFAFEGMTYIYDWSYKTDEYEDDNYEFSIEKYERKLKVELPSDLMDNVSIDPDDNEIEFIERTKQRASKSFGEPDENIIKLMEQGTLYHNYMELVDFVTKDTSFILNPIDRENINKVLNMDIFNDVRTADKVFKEYPYYDEDFETTGFIDLLYIKNGEYFIIDYKLKHTEDDGYQRQLEIYKRNVKRLFGVTDESKIHLSLLSLLECKLYPVK